MNSRRKGRYERRQKERALKRQARCAAVGGLEEVFGFHDLYVAGKKCCNGVRWKNSVQRFELHLLSGTAKRRKLILDGKWVPAKYVHFTLAERGKIRPIDAPRIQDRQIHKLYTRKVLLPLYRPSMIYNNGASLPKKGLSFSRRMLQEDLRKHFRKYGRAGYIVLIDFKQFFPSVSHEEIFKRHSKYLLHPGVRGIGDEIVSTIPGVRGMPLGVEPSQAEMVAFPSALDNYIKCQLSLKHVGHYMDDYYIIVPPGQNPKKICGLFEAKAESLKLTINKNKTKIVPLTKPFRFCKAKYRLTETGKVVVTGAKDTLKRDRRKVKALHKKFQCGKLDYMDLWSSTNGMLAYFNNFNDHARALKLRRLFYALFGFSAESFENFKTKTQRWF